MIFVTLIYQLSINKSRKISSTTNPAALLEYILALHDYFKVFFRKTFR